MHTANDFIKLKHQSTRCKGQNKSTQHPIENTHSCTHRDLLLSLWGLFFNPAPYSNPTHTHVPLTPKLNRDPILTSASFWWKIAYSGAQYVASKTTTTTHTHTKLLRTFWEMRTVWLVLKKIVSLCVFGSSLTSKCNTSSFALVN